MSDDLYCRRCIDRGKALARKDAALGGIMLYANHHPVCGLIVDDPCSCGFEAAIAACREVMGETP